jgi:hypothetical protein
MSLIINEFIIKKIAPFFKVLEITTLSRNARLANLVGF